MTPGEAIALLDAFQHRAFGEHGDAVTEDEYEAIRVGTEAIHWKLGCNPSKHWCKEDAK